MLKGMADEKSDEDLSSSWYGTAASAHSYPFAWYVSVKPTGADISINKFYKRISSTCRPL